MLFKMETTNGDPFAEYMWMGEEQEEFDKKVIEELIEEEQIERDYEDMIEEEDYHVSNSLQIPEEVLDLPPESEEGRPESYQHSGYSNSSSGEEASTTIPRAQEEVPPWGGEESQKSSEVSSDSDSEGGGPQR